MSRPIKLSGRDRPLKFWSPTEPPPEVWMLWVEEEVYRSVRDLLARPPDPDFLLEWMYPGASEDNAPIPAGWGLRLFVDGHRFESIEADIDLGKLVEWEMETHRGHVDGKPTGKPRLNERDFEAYSALARRMRRSLKSLEAWLEESQEPKADEH